MKVSSKAALSGFDYASSRPSGDAGCSLAPLVVSPSLDSSLSFKAPTLAPFSLVAWRFSFIIRSLA
jgi:hypothetical protein